MTRITIKPYVYRGTPGFHVYGTDAWGRRPSIFCKTRDGANEIKAAYKKLPFDADHVSEVVGAVLVNHR